LISLLAVAQLMIGPALATRRISLVAPLCPPEAISLIVDATEIEDACVARGHPVCKSGLELKLEIASDLTRWGACGR
jgi:hypothetical protein